MRTSLFYTLAFALSLLSLLFISVLLWRGFNSLREYTAVVSHRNRVLYNLERLHSYMSNAEAGQRGYLLTGDSLFLRDMHGFEDSIHHIIWQLKALAEEEMTEMHSLQLIDNSINVRLMVLHDNIVRGKQIDSTLLRARLLDGKQWMDVFQQQVKIIASHEMRQLTEVYSQQQHYQSLMPGYLRIALFISGSIAVVSFLVLLYEWKQRSTYQTALEKKLEEVNYYNQEMKEVADVTSHDLQEPLRKMRLFCDMLLVRHGKHLDAEGVAMVNRIQASASDMHQLIENLMLFTSVLRSEENTMPVRLDKVVEEALRNLSAQVEEKKASITVDPLPIVNGHYSQLLMLFTVLLENSLTFTRQGVLPVIRISMQYIKAGGLHPIHKKMANEDFYQITVEDNGMGFDNRFAEKIFSLFQRLHPQTKGRGIGLAVSKRIMVNHDGFITAEGEVNKGARFHLYFPV